MARPAGDLPRFYVDVPLPPASALEADASDAPVTLSAEESRHAVRVLRLRVGDAVELFDGRGNLRLARVDSVSRDAVTCTLEPTIGQSQASPATPIILATAIPKGPAAQSMVDMLSQIGVDVLQPLITERSVVDPREGKLDKWRRQAIESAKQCGRLHVMQIKPPTRLHELCAAQTVDPTAGAEEIRCILLPDGQTTPPKWHASVRRCLLLVGPEGGFTPQECEQAHTAGFVPWRIGEHVMRIETAAVVAGALAQQNRSATAAS